MRCKHLIPPLVVACLLLALSGCGQTGPLYLPKKPAPETGEPAGTH
jgi:predicted small lipoprotein YifL